MKTITLEVDNNVYIKLQSIAAHNNISLEELALQLIREGLVSMELMPQKTINIPLHLTRQQLKEITDEIFAEHDELFKSLARRLSWIGC